MRRYLEFIKEVEGLKSTLRTAWTATGRQESTAEHSWRLALGAAVLCCEFPELDREKVMLMCLVHDLGELYTGDVSAALRPDEGEKHRQEQLDVSRATKAISGPCAKEIMALCGNITRVRHRKPDLLKPWIRLRRLYNTARARIRLILTMSLIFPMEWNIFRKMKN